MAELFLSLLIELLLAVSAGCVYEQVRVIESKTSIENTHLKVYIPLQNPKNFRLRRAKNRPKISMQEYQW